jgi:ABC-type transport system involved in cytochrome c biogenesis permease subunit
MVALTAFTACAYLLSSLCYLFQLIFGGRRTGTVAVVLLSLGAALHTWLLVSRLHGNHYPFILGEGDFYYFASWVAVVAFLILRRVERLLESGSFFSSLALVLFLLGAVRGGEYHFEEPVLANPWALIHILFMSLAFAVFALSFLGGAIFLVQEMQLKNHHPSRFLDRLPSLETIDEIHYKFLTLGFVLLSVGIVSGAALSKSTEGRFFTSDPRQIAALATWALYAVFLNVRIRSGWRGRRGIFLSLIGFCGVAFVFLWLKHRM